ncbi:MAG: DUF4135 domain-containing protein [Bdellovibrionaceae bacterium]|nr:DUF4135 domain-containing protein [Pseudobdellovibrionaceae bacterium]
MFLADTHNFGQQVKRVQQGTDALPCFYFDKPRSVYWEWLFFGQTSPLKNIFEFKSRDPYKTLSNYLFNLDIEILGKWRGRSKEVVEWSGAITNEHFYAFGALIAYCYIFGIRDLHKQNLIKTESHFQVVDAEVVFTRLILPSETLLLPFKHIGYELSGIGVFANNKSEHTLEQKQEIIDGYMDMFSFVIDKKNQIDEIFSSLKLDSHPIRVIIRNTSEYKSILESNEENILKSELCQLSRGDVPFYFKYLGRSELLWLSKINTESSELVPDLLIKDVDRHALFYSIGWCESVASERMMATGILCLRKYFNIKDDYIFAIGDSAFSVQAPKDLK